MKPMLISALAGSLAAVGAAHAVTIEPSRAQPYEVVAKVREAAALLALHGPAGLALLRDKRSAFTWKDTYVFAVDCSADRVLANPAFPERQGGDIKQHTDYDGKRYGLDLCRTAQQPGGGWVQYTWPTPDGGEPKRKISYVMTVEGRSYQVGAGIYDETTTAAQLNALPFAPN